MYQTWDKIVQMLQILFLDLRVLMESKGRKKKSSSSSSLHYEAPLGYIIEDVRPHGGIEKFQSPAYSNGYEKRLEITFSGESIIHLSLHGWGLRTLSQAQIEPILDLAHCTIVSQLSNKFVCKIIFKTCGTTKLLLSIPRILALAEELSLSVLSAKYSCSTFNFPNAQPSPHRSFSEEVAVLDQFFGDQKSGGNASVISDSANSNRRWHVYYATEKPELPMVTLEMCMTGLNTQQASVLYKNSQEEGQASSSKDMRKEAERTD
ncbi:S-adenosylmethionine decarboxylase proenzyme-like [Curcuma longa]|uniref:S-adenosylmethionine decarboxylase proenzyme-like n=1 Tax=Curcuma longa TaxID=136217 RepID=UPI003D9EEC45